MPSLNKTIIVNTILNSLVIWIQQMRKSPSAILSGSLNNMDVFDSATKAMVAVTILGVVKTAINKCVQFYLLRKEMKSMQGRNKEEQQLV